MNVRHPTRVLHSFSIKNIFHDKMDLRFFYFDVAKYTSLFRKASFNSTNKKLVSKGIEVPKPDK